MTLETKCPALHPFKNKYRCFHDNTPCLYPKSEEQCIIYQIYMREKAMRELSQRQELEVKQFQGGIIYGK